MPDQTQLTTQIVAGVFTAEQRSILDNPNLPLNSPEVWNEVFGESYSTDSGVKVNEDTALMYAPVWQAVNQIASDVACLPFNLYHRRPDIADGAREKASNHPTHYIVNVQPRDYMTAQQFWETFMLNALIWNNSFAYIVWDNAGRLKELRHLMPDRTSAEWIKGQLWYVTEYMDDSGTSKLQPLYPWEVLHIKGLCLDGWQAPPFLKYARNSIALGLAQQKFGSKFFANGGRIGGILELPAAMPKPIQQQTEEGFRKMYDGADNPFKTVILRDNAKFHEAQQSPHDSQLVEASESQVRMIARWFNLPPSHLGLSDSVSYNSKSEDNQGYLDRTLKRWLKKIAAECGIKLLSDAAQSQYFFEHDTADLVKMNMEARYRVYQIGRQIGVLSSNEVRQKENMLPREGGDNYDNPATSSSVTEPPAEDPPKEETPKEQERSIDFETVRLRRRVLFNLTAAARHKSKNSKAFIEWLDSEFKVQRDEWTTVSGGKDAPEYFASFHRQLFDLVQTATPQELVTVVDTVAANYEREI